jgi:two-component system OmpR family sensor kinase
MPDTGSARSARWPDLAWAAFAAINIVAMVLWQDWQTVPFHFVWVSLTILYGFRAWRRGSTAAVLLAVAVTTGYALWRRVQVTGEGLDEMTEVPLMSAMFVAMTWHAHRRDVALEQANRSAERERDFVRDASHLLRTPITIARGHAELAASGAEGQARHDLTVVTDELARLSRISNRLLVLAAADHPGFTSVRDVDMGALIDTTVERWAAAAPRRFVADNRLTGTLAADEERLVCALDALLENAVKATREGDLIMLRGAAGPHGTAELEIVDDGAGIAPDALPRVFDRFARDPHQDGGTGLGLPIVKAIVEAHGGSVAIHSVPGEGTCVRLRLPGYAEAEPVPRPIAVPRDGREVAAQPS